MKPVCVECLRALMSPLTSLPSCAFVSPLPLPALQKIVRKVRGVMSCFSDLLLDRWSPSLFSVSHNLLIYTVWYLLSLPLLLSFFFYPHFSFISSNASGSFFIFLLPLLSVCMSVWLFNAALPPCCPLRCFPNFWSLSGAAWPCPPRSFLHSHQERHWDSELCPPSTTTTRWNNFWI